MSELCVMYQIICPTYYFLSEVTILFIKHEDLVFSVKKNTDNINSKMVKTKNGKLMLSSQCSVCENKKSRFAKEQEAKGILSSLGIRTPLSNIPGLNILF